ncbi:hypothetical protein J8244_09480 [Corynebacterium tuberculostearicum]|uniref:hypothetical protein n=1 Tax=Corynebacterium tuberculostearicum TaxID=38304 RepID=UPI002666E00A|nr:hypothetical protein [Corynebacterium tuberculostearicum]WKE50352.1 hypothetical protein J8244_09480 [Corynebacterium tuberculostearicum]
MTDLTTTYLKCLLEQTTLGPWEYEGSQFQEITALDDAELEQPVISLDRYTEKDLCNRPADMNLAAHAPQLAQEVLRMREALHDLSEVWEAVSIDPERTPTEQDLAAAVVDHIDQILGDQDE